MTEDCEDCCGRGFTIYFDGETLIPERCEECFGEGFIEVDFEDQKDFKMEYKAEERYGRYE